MLTVLLILAVIALALTIAAILNKAPLYVDHRPRDLKAAAEGLAQERRETSAQEDEKRRRQQDFGW